MAIEYFPQDHRHYLQFEFEARKKRRPQYSLRAFARDMEVSPSSLSEFLTGKLIFSEERILQVAKRLELDQQHVEHWIDLIRASASPSKADREVAAVRVRARSSAGKGNIALELFEVISEWHHYALLELIDIDEKYQSHKTAGKALGLTAQEVKDAWDRMLRVGLAEKIDGYYKASTLTTFAGEDIPSAALRNYHAGLMRTALTAQEEQTVEKKNFVSIVMSLNSDDIRAIKDEITRFQIDLANKYAQKKNKDSVYCLSSQFFNLVSENLL
jgi:uncharacterized protein (TIGR02147 family)